MSALGSQHIAAIRKDIAPMGILRVGLMVGAYRSPFLATVDQAGQPSGVTRSLGQAIADELELPVEFMAHAQLGAFDAGACRCAFDLTFAPVTEEREAVLAFSQSYFRFRNTLLVPQCSSLKHVDEIDAPSTRIAAQADSVHRKLLGARLQHASLITAESLEQLAGMLRCRNVDAVAHAQPVLKTMERRIGGVRILAGELSVTSLAAAVPRGRLTAWRYLRTYIATALRTGQVERVFSEAGLRADGSA